ncbi:hypothetical protein ACFV30_30920 [Streptomyces sp. NPDC059752]
MPFVEQGVGVRVPSVPAPGFSEPARFAKAGAEAIGAQVVDEGR